MEPVIESGTGPERPSVGWGIGSSPAATGSVVPFLEGRLRWLRNPAIVLALIAGVMPFSCRAADESLEYQVKAAFLLNFTKFVEWPAMAFKSAESPISICILGNDPFGSALDKVVAGEVVNGRKVTAQRIKRAPSP